MKTENMDNFIPKNAVKLCNRCQNHICGTVTCKLYPTRIPHNVLVGEPLCKEYQEKKED
jgi:hypothetical protein